MAAAHLAQGEGSRQEVQRPLGAFRSASPEAGSGVQLGSFRREDRAVGCQCYSVNCAELKPQLGHRAGLTHCLDVNLS